MQGYNIYDITSIIHTVDGQIFLLSFMFCAKPQSGFETIMLVTLSACRDTKVPIKVLALCVLLVCAVSGSWFVLFSINAPR